MSFPCWYSLNASDFNHFFKFGNKTWSACARKVTVRYYLFALFDFWMRSTVNTFMLLLLPKGLFLLCFLHLCYTCSRAFGCFQVCFTYLMILGKQAWFSMTPCAAILNREEFCLRKSCRICAMHETRLCLWQSISQPVWVFTGCSKCTGSFGKAGKVIKSRTLPFQETPPRACASAAGGWECPGEGMQKGCSSEVVRVTCPAMCFRGKREYDGGETHSILN